LSWTDRDDYNNLAIVAHGGTIAALICSVLNEPVGCMWQYLQANTALNRVRRQPSGHYYLLEYNGQAHLKQGK
jgi:broad specificity phosphatase PhoE